MLLQLCQASALGGGDTAASPKPKRQEASSVATVAAASLRLGAGPLRVRSTYSQEV